MNQEVVSKFRGEHKNAQDLLTYLPSEIILNILLRLPTRTIMICKCVCKAWLHLLTTPEFVKSHLSNSVPGLLVVSVEEEHSMRCITVEFEDDRRCNKVFNFDLPVDSHPFNEPMHSSTNGLVLFQYAYAFTDPEDLFICNPITREYIKLPPPLQPCSEPIVNLATYGFGVSKVSGQYKVVRIFIQSYEDCQVYTVGSGSWRRIATESDDHQRLWYGEDVGSFLNGNLHWLGSSHSSFRISCFDLETEVFSSFCAPPLGDGDMNPPVLSVLGDHLCVCDTLYHYKYGMPQLTTRGLDIWLMKEYGDEKSWTKQFVIEHFYTHNESAGYPIKVFKDGDILIEWGRGKLFYYSTERENIQRLDLSTEPYCNSFNYSTTIYAPSFVPLKTFAMEKVSSF